MRNILGIGTNIQRADHKNQDFGMDIANQDLHEFLQNYEMYKLEKLFPVKHIKLKTNKI